VAGVVSTPVGTAPTTNRAPIPSIEPGRSVDVVARRAIFPELLPDLGGDSN
jgi:hypothetical protein